MTNPFTFRSDWPAVCRPAAYNWIEWTPIHASAEYEKTFGHLEFHVALLGFHLYGRWKVAEGDKAAQDEIHRMVEAVGREHAP